ncbi:MAG: type II secretion system protein [Bacillota bacterium]
MKNMVSCGLFTTSGGYSFIELLVAVTILGFVIAALLGLFTNSFQAITSAGKETTAVYLGQDKLETLKAKGFLYVHQNYTEAGTNSLIEDNLPGFNGFTRTTEVRVLNPPGSDNGHLANGLLQLDVKVSFALNGAQQEKTLSSYLAER